MEARTQSLRFSGGSTDSAVLLSLDVINDSQKDLFIIVNFVGVCGVLCLFGMGANVLNMIVFYQQGFESTANISFFGLAISDFCCVTTMFWQGVCLNPLVINSDVVWIPLDFVYLTAAWPHNISGRITSYITIYVTLERYLCITVPLKVKEIFSPARTTVAVVLIFVVNISILVPEYATCYLDWNFFPHSNRTLLSITFTSGRAKVEGLVYIINCISGILSFVVVILVTCVLVVKLKETSQWRKEATSGSHQQKIMSNRDKKMLKMITFIACVLIVCYTPGVVVSLVTFVEPQFDLAGKYSNSFVSMWSVSCIFQVLNSSINVCLYYRMSSKYRETFQKLFIGCSIRGTIASQQESMKTNSGYKTS